MIYFILGVFTGIVLLWLLNKKPTQIINQVFTKAAPIKAGHLQ